MLKVFAFRCGHGGIVESGTVVDYVNKGLTSAATGIRDIPSSTFGGDISISPGSTTQKCQESLENLVFCDIVRCTTYAKGLLLGSTFMFCQCHSLFEVQRSSTGHPQKKLRRPLPNYVVACAGCRYLSHYVATFVRCLWKLVLHGARAWCAAEVSALPE